MLFYYISLILATQPSDSAPNKTSTVKNSNLHLSSESKSYAEVLSKPIFFARFFRLSASVGFFKDSNKETTTPTDLLPLKRFRNYFHVEQETWGLYALIKRYFREKWKFRSLFKTVLLYYYTLYCSVLRTRYCFLLSCNNGTFRLRNPDNKTCSCTTLLYYLYFSVKPETLHNQECTKIKIRTTCKMLEKFFWVLYKKLTHALLTEFLKVGSDDAL